MHNTANEVTVLHKSGLSNAALYETHTEASEVFVAPADVATDKIETVKPLVDVTRCSGGQYEFGWNMVVFIQQRVKCCGND